MIEHLLGQFTLVVGGIVAFIVFELLDDNLALKGMSAVIVVTGFVFGGMVGMFVASLFLCFALQTILTVTVQTRWTQRIGGALVVCACIYWIQQMLIHT